jgi:hypothetical protein
VVGIADDVGVAGDGIDPGLVGQLLGGDLVTHRLDRPGLGPDEGDAVLGQLLAEIRVLGQEAVSRVDRLGAGVEAGLDDLVDQQVALRRRRRADVDGLVGQLHVQGVAVGVGVDGDTLDAHLARGLDDAAGDFAAIRNEDFIEHCLRPLRSAQSGILSCLRHGFSSFLSRSIDSERQMRLRVACGAMTSSM